MMTLSPLTSPLPARPTLLVVDDTPANLRLLTDLLKHSYRVKVANDGARALELVAEEVPDLILLDVMMPAMDGYEVCRRLKANPASRQVPVIFLTAMTDPEGEEQGFAAGAVDFIHKPISPPIVAARVRTHLEISAWQLFLQDRNRGLEQEVERRLSQVTRLQDASIQVMVSLAEFRDECTGNHIRRTQEYVRVLAETLCQQGASGRQLSPEQIALLVKSAPLHDIGKIAIPDHILLKPGKLTPEEFAVMQGHALRGFDILERAGRQMGETGDFLGYALQIARSHHEKWDGNGYPDRLAGDAIPLAARLMAVADVYDALRTRRPYKRPFSHEEAQALLLEGRGSHFDPWVIDAFMESAATFAAIAERWPDDEDNADNAEENAAAEPGRAT